MARKEKLEKLARSLRIRRIRQEREVSFLINRMMRVGQLLKDSGTLFNLQNGLVRKALHKYYKERITIFPEYLLDIANFKKNSLSRGKKAQD